MDLFLDVETQVFVHGDGSDGSVFVANHGRVVDEGDGLVGVDGGENSRA